jgi:hypothetical protein
MPGEIPTASVTIQVMEKLAVELAVINANATVTRDLSIELRDAVNELTTELKVFADAMAILKENSGGKRPTWADFAQAYFIASEAADEDEPGNGSPVIDLEPR